MDFLIPNIVTIAFFLLITFLIICGAVYFFFKKKLNSVLMRKVQLEKNIKQLNKSASDNKEKIEQEKKKIDEKNKNLWKMSEAIHKEKEEIEKENQQLVIEKSNLEQEKKKFEEINKKLWRSSVTILKEKDRIEKIKQLFEQKNQEITESIIYAQRIQRATLPATEKLYNVFPESFIFYQPKELVSGDFYWFTTKDDDFLVSAVDCTGHGVPGAFMSMMGNGLLNYIVIEKGISKPEQILQELDRRIITTLTQNIDLHTSPLIETTLKAAKGM
ncbi:MAG: SpoIIE family protein phosphatase, partial [Bacteroidetes bacterium]|nr:SpoIIE family protein phosphatase [Bacteroidota bacterium]